MQLSLEDLSTETSPLRNAGPWLASINPEVGGSKVETSRSTVAASPSQASRLSSSAFTTRAVSAFPGRTRRRRSDADEEGGGEEGGGSGAGGGAAEDSAAASAAAAADMRGPAAECRARGGPAAPLPPAPRGT